MSILEYPLTVTSVIDVIFATFKTFAASSPSLGLFLKTICNFPIWVAFAVGLICLTIDRISKHKYIRYLNTRHHIVESIAERGGVVPVQPKLRTHFSPRLGDRDITSATPTSASRRWN